MKKLISLITAVALIFQFGILSGFAAASPDKTLFKDISEIYGVYDCSYTYISLLEVTKEGMTPYLRNFSEKDFYVSEDFTFNGATYVMSKDKKAVTATFTTYLEGVQYQGQYIFKKDATGKIYFNATLYNGVNRTVTRSFANLDACIDYIYSTAFSKTYLAEKSYYKKAKAANEAFEAQSKKFEDAKPISTQNLLQGYYPSSDSSQYVTVYTYSDCNPKDYSGFYNYTEVQYIVGAKTYQIKAKSFTVTNGVALYLEDSKNYAEIKSINRGTLANIKIVKNGKVVVDKAVSLTLEK